MRLGSHIPELRCVVRRAAFAVLATGVLWMIAGAPAQALEHPYAAIIIDADSGRVLYEHQPDASTHPASLAKMMTLYLTFEDLRAGKLKTERKLKISSRAASQPPSRLGLRKGAAINVQTAILALVTKSANDVASVLAENLAGSEHAFARRMTAKARELGMTSTRFRNASGLHHPDQITTARDMMVLAGALLRDFPDESRYFSVREFQHGGRVYSNHNGLLATYAGTDGIKTGYIRAAGFHLAASVHRDGQHLLGIVMGGRNAAVRDLNMIYLFERALAHLRVEQSGGELTNALVKGPAPEDWEFNIAALPQSLIGEGDGTSTENWGVQVGAYSDPALATASMTRATGLLPNLLDHATPSVVKITTQGRTLHRARVTGISHIQARLACAQLLSHDLACMPVEPGGSIRNFN